jgi:eukaryotic-like serine/threonine-protein kinase
MTNTSDTPAGADDETIAGRPDTVEVQRVVTTNEPRALPDDVIPPHPGGPVDPLVPTVVTEDERVVVEPDGAVRRQAERVEYAPEKRRRSGLVPALLIVLAIALAAIAAAWYFGQSDTASVPSVTGLPLDAAVTRLEDDGFKADIVSQPNEAAQGIVFQQSPGAGSEQDEGSDVQLLVSKGPAEVTVPNTVGVPETEARDRLATAGLKATVVEVFSSSEIGNVIAQDPAAGGKAATGSEVRLNVSKGSAEVDVPSVIGLSQADATAQVKAAGLVVNVVPVPSDQPAGIVVAQNPVGGQADRGSNVRLNVSSGS